MNSNKPDSNPGSPERTPTALERDYHCPKCLRPMTEICYPSDSMLNRDQWESQLPGDLFCTCHNNHRGNKPYAYFWKSDFKAAEAAPLPAEGVTPREKGVFQQGVHVGLQMAANYVQAHDNLGDIAAKEILDLERQIPAAFAEIDRQTEACGSTPECAADEFPCNFPHSLPSVYQPCCKGAGHSGDHLFMPIPIGGSTPECVSEIGGLSGGQSNRGVDRLMDDNRASQQSNDTRPLVPSCSICGKDSHFGDKCYACKAAESRGYVMQVDDVSGSKQFRDFATWHFWSGYKAACKEILKERMAAPECVSAPTDPVFVGGKCPTCGVNLNQVAAPAVESAPSAEAKWISVKEKLPRPQQFVLGYYAEDDMEVTWHTGEIWSTDESGEPTHWMPLPEKPALRRGSTLEES